MNYVWGLIERWPYVLGALFAAGIVHIATTLIMPHLTSADAYSRLSQSLPANSFVVLPLARPGTQVLPFQDPEARYAICRFDTTSGPVVLSATLPEVGWTLSVYSSKGENIYALPAASSRSVDVRLVVMPPGDRFVGVVPESRSADLGLTQLQSPSPGGLAVLRAPLKAHFFAAQVERDLLRANCRQQAY